MLNAHFVPIDKWPGKPTPYSRRKSATFRASYLKTLDLLESELDKLHAKEILIQAYFQRTDIRNDGWPKNTAKPSDAGVIVSFESPKGPLSFPCDTFIQYEDNLRAIGLALQALRAVDRYGVTRNNEQYKGWAQLPAPSQDLQLGDAALVIAQYSGFIAQDIIARADTFRAAYREACRKAHPDAGGSHDAFVAVSRAKAALDKHHGEGK